MVEELESKEMKRDQLHLGLFCSLQQRQWSGFYVVQCAPSCQRQPHFYQGRVPPAYHLRSRAITTYDTRKNIHRNLLFEMANAKVTKTVDIASDTVAVDSFLAKISNYVISVQYLIIMAKYYFVYFH